MTAIYDIAVVGGGVAGIISALRCAEYGFRVLVCIKDVPSPHALQSIHPSVINSFADIGLGRNITEPYLTLSHSRVCWGESELDTSQREPTLLLDRVSFDAALLKVSREADIHIASDTKGFVWSDQGDEKWLLCAKDSGKQYHCGYLINASGQLYVHKHTLLRQGRKTLVLRGQWKHAKKDKACTFIDSAADCWFWGATLGGKSNLNIFLSPTTFKASRSKGKGLKALFRQSYMDYRWRNDMPSLNLVDCDVLDATHYVSAAPLNQRMALVGGAAIRVDPLSSQGIQIAFATAIQASIAVNTLLKRPANLDDAITFYRQRIRQRSSDHALFQNQTYADAEAFYKSPFWSERTHAVEATPLHLARQPASVDYYRCYRLSREARFDYLPAICGDFIEPLYGLTHPGLQEPSFITNKNLIENVLLQLLRMPLMMVLNYPPHRAWRDELEQLLLYWVGSGVLEVQQSM